MGVFNFKLMVTIFVLLFGISQAFFLGNWQERSLRRQGVSQETINAVHREICNRRCSNGTGLFFIKNQLYCATACSDVLNATSATSTSTSTTSATSASNSATSTTSSTSSTTQAIL